MYKNSAKVYHLNILTKDFSKKKQTFFIQTRQKTVKHHASLLYTGTFVRLPSISQHEKKNIFRLDSIKNRIETIKYIYLCSYF